MHVIVVREFSEQELETATKSFSELLGNGSFGSVYKGMLQHTHIAVKVMKPVSLHVQCLY